jgi:hypothetical protein
MNSKIQDFCAPCGEVLHAHYETSAELPRSALFVKKKTLQLDFAIEKRDEPLRAVNRKQNITW